MEEVDQLMNFGEAIEALKDGKCVQRAAWDSTGSFIMKQIPAEIGLDIIPKMQSVQDDAKKILLAIQTPLKYMNQILHIQFNGRADSWAPSASDVFAEDWRIVIVHE